MNIEYGLITKNMTEKEILKVLNAKLKTFFLEMVDEEYDMYKSYSLKKMRNLGGVSYNPKQIPWDYEYFYHFWHKHYGLAMEMYPNTNDKGEQKFKNPDVKWNLYVRECGGYVKNVRVFNKNNPDIKRFKQFLLQDLPFEVVVVYEYEEGEERI
ncbi:MAG: hypothetical protein IJF07_01575 [Lachnospiraceae bacterium]|nr:hypothetical protein [Lachnospiraceae bacterium]